MPLAGLVVGGRQFVAVIFVVLSNAATIPGPELEPHLTEMACPSPMNTILIIGASRGIGLETVRRTLDQGYQVRAFARSAFQMPLTHTHLTKLNGDALRAEDVAMGVKSRLQCASCRLDAIPTYCFTPRQRTNRSYFMRGMRRGAPSI
jgi:hypothetical protein